MAEKYKLLVPDTVCIIQAKLGNYHYEIRMMLLYSSL